jgi:hypothetical protein
MIRTVKQGMWTVGVRDTVYVTYSIKNSAGWIKVGEYAFAEMEQADRFIADTLSRYPNDVARFEKRIA